MYSIINLRNKDGKIVPIPIMATDSEDEPTDTMAIWGSIVDAQLFCDNHILCRTSNNIIINLEDGDSEIY